MNTRKFKGLDSREITSLPDIEKVIYIARHFNRRNKSHARHKTYLPTIPLSTVHLLQSNVRFQAIAIRGPIRFGKALNLIFPKLSSHNMRGFDHATILSPSFHGLRKERLAQ